MSRHLTYFVSDVHLGLDYKDPAAREARFVDFLRSIPAAETESLYMLGDIWDFWYEYRDVVPKGYVRVFSALMDLRDAGVRLYFFKGNHDVWTYSYFESLGIKILAQPHVTVIGGRTFCLTATVSAPVLSATGCCAPSFTTASCRPSSPVSIPGWHSASERTGPVTAVLPADGNMSSIRLLRR